MRRSNAHPSGDRRRWGRAGAVVAALVAVVSLVALAIGWSGGTSSDSQSSTADMATGGAGALESEAGSAVSSDRVRAATTRSGDTGANPISEVALVERSVIRTGAVSLVNEDVEAARREVLAVTDALGGYVADEQSRANRTGRLVSVDLTLQVPTDDLDTAMTRIGAAGTVVGRSQSARDVTEQVVDIDSRVASAEVSLRRVRLLLDRASSLGSVIRLEQVLSARQADLESLLAQQQSLAAATSLATLRVDVSGPPAPPRVEEPEEAGFLAGLARGWDALVTGYVVLATTVGAVLPTAIVLGLLAHVLRFVVRRTRWTRWMRARGRAPQPEG